MSDETKLAAPGTMASLEQNPEDPAKWERVPAFPKHRIVHAWVDGDFLWVLGSDGRMFFRMLVGRDWHEMACYPPGLEP